MAPAPLPVEVPVVPLPGPEASGVGKPPVPSFDVLVMPETPATEVLEVTSEADVPPDDEVIPAEALLKPKWSAPGAESKLAEVRSVGYEKVPLGSRVEYAWSASTSRSVAFQRVTTVEPGALPNVRAVTVTVSWTDRGPRREMFTSELTP